MATAPLESGPTGKRVAGNLALFRRILGLSQRDLSERMSDLGRPLLPQVLSKIEQVDRRVDADDLVALALALQVTPNQLLLEGAARPDEPVALTPTVTKTATDAWRWANGLMPPAIGPGSPVGTMSIEDAVRYGAALAPLSEAIRAALDTAPPEVVRQWFEHVMSRAEASQTEGA